MKIIGKYLKPFLQVMLITCIISLASGVGLSAEEPLFLTGKVISIDHALKQVVVDVKNKGCKGIKRFSVDDLSKYKIAEGDEIKFFIDSAYCPGTEVRGITNMWGVKK